MREIDQVQHKLFQLMSNDLYAGGELRVSDAFEYYTETARTLCKIVFEALLPVGISLFSTGVVPENFLESRKWETASALENTKQMPEMSIV